MFICVLVACTAYGQNTPTKVKQAFSKTHSAASAVKWEKEDGNYEVSFKENGNQFSLIYNAQGDLLETEEEIAPNTLPAAIKAYMSKQYAANPLKSAAKITKADGTVLYEAAIKNKDIIFDVKGTFIKVIKD